MKTAPGFTWPKWLPKSFLKYLLSPNLMVGGDTWYSRVKNSLSLSLFLHDLSLRALLIARSGGGSLNMQLHDTEETPRTKTHPEQEMVSQPEVSHGAVKWTQRPVSHLWFIKEPKGMAERSYASQHKMVIYKLNAVSHFRRFTCHIKKHTKYQLTPQGVAEGWDCDSFIRIWRNVHSHSFFEINRQFCVI